MLAPQHPPLVSDALLAELAEPDYDQQRGEYSAETRALLASALPEICAELLECRRAVRDRPFALSLALRSEAITARLNNARVTIRAPGPILPGILRDACETLIRHSSDAFERQAATDVLAQIREVA